MLARGIRASSSTFLQANPEDTPALHTSLVVPLMITVEPPPSSCSMNGVFSLATAGAIAITVLRAKAVNPIRVVTLLMTKSLFEVYTVKN